MIGNIYKIQEKATAQESIEKPKKKCLFIDDNRPIIEGARALLSEYDNFVAVECHSVEDAINAIKQIVCTILAAKLTRY